MKHEHTGYSGASQGTLRSYMTGFVLSIVLTVVPFFMVMNGSLPERFIVIGIALCAVVQILVHLVYFLHMNNNSELLWNFISLVFTVLVIAIIVVGSLWIMYNLNVNMMPE